MISDASREALWSLEHGNALVRLRLYLWWRVVKRRPLCGAEAPGWTIVPRQQAPAKGLGVTHSHTYTRTHMLTHTWGKKKQRNTNPNSHPYLTKKLFFKLSKQAHLWWFGVWQTLSHECSSCESLSCFPVSVGAALSLGYGDWSERKDSGSLVWERGGRKGNQATWANTWGSAQTLSTQMCTQLRLPGSRRRLCCSLIVTFFSFTLFCLSFFTLLLSALYSVFNSPSFPLCWSLCLSLPI